MSTAQPRLLTFGPMIDSELSRVLLRHYGVAYVEERHIFGYASLLTLLHGGTGFIPLLYGTGLRLTGPRAIVDHYEPTCAPERLLLPAQEPARTAVEADWRLFNGDLGAETARLAYFHLLSCREAMIEAFARGMTAGEARFVGPLYGVLRSAFTLLLHLGADAAADALLRIRRIVEDVDARLADGRRYIGGDTLTLADLALATALAPLVLPDGYKAPIPSFAQMPAVLQDVVTELRRHPAAALVGRIYAPA